MVYPCHDCIYYKIIRTPNITENIGELWNETEVCAILQTELHDDILCSFKCPNYGEKEQDKSLNKKEEYRRNL